MFKSLVYMYGVSCMYRKAALNAVCMALCCLYIQYHDVVLHLTEDGCSLEAVGQETEEAVVPISDTHSNRTAPRSTANMYVAI